MYPMSHLTLQTQMIVNTLRRVPPGSEIQLCEQHAEKGHFSKHPTLIASNCGILPMTDSLLKTLHRRMNIYFRYLKWQNLKIGTPRFGKTRQRSLCMLDDGLSQYFDIFSKDWENYVTINHPLLQGHNYSWTLEHEERCPHHSPPGHRTTCNPCDFVTLRPGLSNPIVTLGCSDSTT